MEAVLHGVGAAMRATDAVMSGEVANAFCGVRPPGHHAEPERAMGFCFFNNVAIAAMHARAKHGAERVAVVDFDVHHGNGTQAAFWSERESVLRLDPSDAAVSGQRRPARDGARRQHLSMRRCAPATAAPQFREAIRSRILPALANFSPDHAVIISAGFDAHRGRSAGQSVNWSRRISPGPPTKLAEIAHKQTGGRIVSLLEGGYNLTALARSVAVHVERADGGGAINAPAQKTEQRDSTWPIASSQTGAIFRR